MGGKPRAEAAAPVVPVVPREHLTLENIVYFSGDAGHSEWLRPENEKVIAAHGLVTQLVDGGLGLLCSDLWGDHGRPKLEGRLSASGLSSLQRGCFTALVEAVAKYERLLGAGEEVLASRPTLPRHGVKKESERLNAQIYLTSLRDLTRAFSDPRVAEGEREVQFWIDLAEEYLAP